MSLAQPVDRTSLGPRFAPSELMEVVGLEGWRGKTAPEENYYWIEHLKPALQRVLFSPGPEERRTTPQRALVIGCGRGNVARFLASGGGYDIIPSWLWIPGVLS